MELFIWLIWIPAWIGVIVLVVFFHFSVKNLKANLTPENRSKYGLRLHFASRLPRGVPFVALGATGGSIFRHSALESVLTGQMLVFGLTLAEAIACGVLLIPAIRAEREQIRQAKQTAVYQDVGN